MTSFPMKDLAGSGRTSAYSDTNADAPVSSISSNSSKTFILYFFFVI